MAKNIMVYELWLDGGHGHGQQWSFVTLSIGMPCPSAVPCTFQRDLYWRVMDGRMANGARRARRLGNLRGWGFINYKRLGRR